MMPPDLLNERTGRERGRPRPQRWCSISSIVDGDLAKLRPVQTPVTALLRIPDPRRQLAAGRVSAQLELYPSSEAEAVLIDHQPVPLEAEYTATLAYMLSGMPVWEFEFGGFLRGGLLEQKLPSRLIALEPYRAGRIPVVFVHGTASSAVRWAEMLNDLRGDPRIRDH